MVKGLPREADYEALDRLADTIADKHRELVSAALRRLAWSAGRWSVSRRAAGLRP